MIEWRKTSEKHKRILEHLSAHDKNHPGSYSFPYVVCELLKYVGVKCMGIAQANFIPHCKSFENANSVLWHKLPYFDRRESFKRSAVNVELRILTRQSCVVCYTTPSGMKTADNCTRNLQQQVWRNSARNQTWKYDGYILNISIGGCQTPITPYQQNLMDEVFKNLNSLV